MPVLQMSDLNTILKTAVDARASDVHIAVGQPPLFRVHTVVTPSKFPVVTAEDSVRLARQMLTDRQWADFEEKQDADFSYQIPGGGRFRVNAHFQQRTSRSHFESSTTRCGRSRSCFCPALSSGSRICRAVDPCHRPPAPGKSTTLAAMIDSINRREAGHIITLEDPIEYAFVSAKSCIEQREMGSDCPSFASGLRHALRQDPDVILVGEMRDLETVGSAITAAETGHLVFSTLHYVNAPQTIERIIGVYPSDQQNRKSARCSLTPYRPSSARRCSSGSMCGMIPALEIMLCTPAVRNCVRENRQHYRHQPRDGDADIGRFDQTIVRQWVHQPRRCRLAGGVSGEAGQSVGCVEIEDGNDER